jgi:hypothetical protein
MPELFVPEIVARADGASNEISLGEIERKASFVNPRYHSNFGAGKP